ncbi:hypothetical protein MATL_G00136360 [Megalops atlanticus]|uniref:Uncharacterized protein n=1 Tax=Megalops atlanticus TaxID=7932 RepID=A0A9D3TCD9_MEGAT|nr:hypothetical protein MATL_G00136360 [Megalops atlanticus]
MCMAALSGTAVRVPWFIAFQSVLRSTRKGLCWRRRVSARLAHANRTARRVIRECSCWTAGRVAGSGPLPRFTHCM